MHPHLIDWLRNTDIHSDETTPEKRWKAAKAYGEGLTRVTATRLLRLFLFGKPDDAQAKLFTGDLLTLDKDFPVTGNTELLRLMAGVVMVSTFAEPSMQGDAFALGLRAALFPGRLTQPAQQEIILEAESYLLKEALRLRPTDFGVAPASTEDLETGHAAVLKAQQSGDPAKLVEAQNGYQQLAAEVMQECDEALAEQVRRLAEETAFLWWVLGEHSTSLKRPTTELSAEEYALVAGSEAAERTHILPPPPSARALLERVLKPCKPAAKKGLKLVDFLGAADADWRTKQLQRVVFTDCTDLVPLLAGLAKTEEFEDPHSAAKVVPKVCPGVDIRHPLTPGEVAEQFYVEIVFLRALAELKSA